MMGAKTLIILAEPTNLFLSFSRRSSCLTGWVGLLALRAGK
jgi:hypothetical protein